MPAVMSSALPRVLRLPADATSAAAAREFVAECLERWGLDACADEAGLVVDELVTNAIKHARSPMTLSVAHRSDRVVVQVEDDSSADPQPRPATGSLEESGRGLRLVSQMSLEWGTTPLPTGKRVWAEISLEPTGR
jgi:anti-sigma regulatory factor (Ser/Thr protein kinase)